MSRAKPYRSKPTRDFMIYYDIALQSRYFLVQENGPTKLTLEANNRKKYKISVGSEITCSCGGGRTEHCVHTIYALMKIFRIGEGDPLIWQLSFTDTELEKILERRERQVLRNRQAYNEYQQYRGIEDQYRSAMQQLRQEEGWTDRNAQLNLNPSADIMGDADPRRQGTGIRIGNSGIRIGGGQAPGKNWAEKATENRSIVPPRPLEDEEMCCVCCDTLREDEDLSHCRYSCGRQIHTDCLMRCFKHNESSGKPLNCPLCRTNWGPMGIEILKENTKAWREKKKQAQAETNKTASVNQLVHGALKSNKPPAAAQQVGGASQSRGFQCSSCKRTLMYEGKYQCMVCPNIAICKLCFGVKYHDQHEFVTRPQPDRDWEPAFRNNNPLQQNEEYKKLMEELQERELGPDDYDLLLSLENKKNAISLPRWLAMGFEKAYPPPQSYFDIPKAYCAFCEAEIVDKQTGLQLKNCNHHIHKGCLQDLLTTKNVCPLCDQQVLLGYEACLNEPKMTANKVTKTIAQAAKKKKKPINIDANLEAELQRQAEQNIALQFGISGSNFSGMGAAEESQAVGRRDLFRLPGDAAAQRGRGRGGPARNQLGRPPINSRRPPQGAARHTEEEKKEPSALAQGSFGGDFNLAGTQIGGTPVTTTTKDSTQMGADSRQGGSNRVQMGMSFRQRPHSLNNRFPQEEEKKGSALAGLGSPLELNATGLGRGRFRPGAQGAHSSASVSALQERLGNSVNKHRLARDMQQYQDFDEDVLDRFQERFDDAMRDKKVKESIMKNQKEKALTKAKQLGKNAPLKKYYQNQINNQTMEINATGLQTALQGSELTQTKIGTGQTPKNVLQDSAMRITQSGLPNRKKPTIVRGSNLNGQGAATAAPLQGEVLSEIRVGATSSRGQQRARWGSQQRPPATNQRQPLRRNHQQPGDPSGLANFAGDIQPQVRQIAQNRAARPQRGLDLSNCGLIAGAIPTNDPIFADGFTGGGVNNIRAMDDMGIFGTQVER